MFLRGMLWGVGIVVAMVAWLKAGQPTASDTPPLELSVSHVDHMRIARRRDSVLTHIAKESPWILKPSAKPSTNSSASSSH